MDIQHRFDKLDDGQAEILQLLNDHIAKSGERDAHLEERVASAHKRINAIEAEHKEKRTNATTMWIGLVVSFLGSIFAAVIALITFKGEHK